MERKMKDLQGSVLKTKASKDLQIEVEKELEQKDPVQGEKTLGQRILEKLGKETLDD